VNDPSATCRDNNSIFLLVGNPGIIWHPQSGRFLHTILITRHSGGGFMQYSGMIVYLENLKMFFFIIGPNVTHKTLIASDRCDRNDPNMAFFKYDKNKPERLSYLADVDAKTGKREEWYICISMGGILIVHSNCIRPDYSNPPSFHEIV